MAVVLRGWFLEDESSQEEVASPPSPSDEENRDSSKADREEDAFNGACDCVLAFFVTLCSVRHQANILVFSL